MKNQLHPLTVELLKLLDKEKACKPTQENIIEAPSNLFFTIKQMYNSFKKDNESRILQNKVYELKIEENEEKKDTFKVVQIETICEAHSKHNEYETINNLIQIKDYFTLVNHINDLQAKQKEQELRKEKEKSFEDKSKYEQYHKWQQLIKWIIEELISCIVKEIIKIDDLETILKLFTKILKTKECIIKNNKNDDNDRNMKNLKNGKNKLYEKIEKQMMNKILSFNSLFNSSQIKMISQFLIGLPYLDVQALIFISELYDKIENLNDFNHLKLLYTKVYQKVESSLKEDSENDSKNDPINEKFRDMLKDMLLDSLMKIAIDDHISEIRKTLQQIDERKKQPISMKDDIEDEKFLKALHKEAINKMEQYIKIAKSKQAGSHPTLTYSSETELDQTINEKEKQVLKFIFCALESEALFNENSKFKVWHHFIYWYHISTWKESFSPEITPLVQKILESPKNALKVMQVLYETEGGESDKALSQNIDLSLTVENLNDSISNFFVRQLLSGLSNYTKYLNNKIAMKLASLVIMKEKDGFEIYESIVFNHSNLSYIDIIIECFDIPKVTEFFNRLMNSPQKRTSLQVYLTTLLEQKPNKYKIFFSKIDRHNEGEIFQLSEYFLLRFFEQSLIPTDHTDLILSFIREMASFTPSSYTIEILNRFISKAGEEKRIYYQAARTLNIILCTKEAKDLPFKFKKDLKDIVASKVLAAEHVFINVPKKMNDDLSAFYNPNAVK